MHRKTKNKSKALERAVELAGGTVKRTDRQGWRRVRFRRPTNGPIEVEDRLDACLYVVVNALTTAVDLGGFGKTMQEVRDHVRFYGTVKDTGKGHENNVLRALRMEGGR